jgi:peptide deformylase
MKDAIVQAGAPVLRHAAKPVLAQEFGGRALKALVAKMKKALAREEYGVAIAAPQVGSSSRIFIVAGRVFDEEPKLMKQKSGSPKGGPRTFAEGVSEDRIFINPEILRLSRKKQEMSEGCGKAFTYHGAGLLAQIFQHEVEHLEGILFTDKAVRVWEDPEMATPNRI